MKKFLESRRLQDMRSTYDDVDTFAGSRRSDKHARLLMGDQQLQQAREPHGVDGWHDDLAVHCIARYRRHVRQRVGPLHPLTDAVFHQLEVVDKTVSWDRRQVRMQQRFGQAREVQSDTRLFGHCALKQTPACSIQVYSHDITQNKKKTYKITQSNNIIGMQSIKITSKWKSVTAKLKPYNAYKDVIFWISTALIF